MKFPQEAKKTVPLAVHHAHKSLNFASECSKTGTFYCSDPPMKSKKWLFVLQPHQDCSENLLFERGLAQIINKNIDSIREGWIGRISQDALRTHFNGVDCSDAKRVNLQNLENNESGGIQI